MIFTHDDERSAEWKAILAWLESHGAPPATLRRELGKEPFAYETAQLRFSKPGFEDLDLDAGLVLRGPEVALTELESHFKFGDPSVRKHFRYVPDQPPPPPPGPSPLPSPASPVGEPISSPAVIVNFLRTYSYVPLGLYFSSAVDNYADGEQYVDRAGVKYRKHRFESPFGYRQFWERIS